MAPSCTSQSRTGSMEGAHTAKIRDKRSACPKQSTLSGTVTVPLASSTHVNLPNSGVLVGDVVMVVTGDVVVVGVVVVGEVVTVDVCVLVSVVEEVGVEVKEEVWVVILQFSNVPSRSESIALFSTSATTSHVEGVLILSAPPISHPIV